MTAGIPAAKLRPPPPLGIGRDRLTRPVLDGDRQLWVVHGVAGCGKSTVLGQLARAWPGPTVWVTVDGTDRVRTRLLRALGAAVGAPPDPPADDTDAVFGVIEALEASPERTLLVVDDVHQLAGSPAAEVLDLLCRYRPAQVTVALGTRHYLPSLHHWRWRSADDAGEVDSDGLRFRLWEVDTLFRQHYRTPLTSSELHTVSRLTDGWAVALHLFHVATRTLPASEWRRLVAGPRLTLRSIRDYLADQVLATVDADDRSLLRRVAVLDRIRPDRCERLLARSGCAPQLHRLADVGLLLPDPDGVTYRLHELLRAHLLGELDDELGGPGVAGLHRLAADVLEAEGDVAEAVRACGRGGDWDGVRRLLSQADGGVVLAGDWTEGLPRHLRDTDPWLLRAVARRRLGEGDLVGARAMLTTSVERFGEHGGDRATSRQLHLLNGWLAPEPGQQRTWTECLRAALAGGTVAAWPDEPAGWLGEGLAYLVTGRVDRATDLLGQASSVLAGELGVLAELGLCLAATLGDPAPAPVVERALAGARVRGAPALVAVAESLVGLVAGEAVAPDLQAAAALERGDQLGAAVLQLVGGLGLLRERPADAVVPLRAASAGFGDLGLPVLQALAEATRLLARARTPSGSVHWISPQGGRSSAQNESGERDGRGDGLAGEVLNARAVGPLPHALALLAQAAVTGDAAAEQQACLLAGQHGFAAFVSGLTGDARPSEGVAIDRVAPARPAAWSSAPAATATAATATSPAVEVRCLGQLRLVVDGEARPVEELRPRHQQLLGILGSHPNGWVHRERLADWLWPDAEVDRATRNLQVAVSAVRRLVEPGAAPGRATAVVRSGERYRLTVAPEHSDVARLDAALTAARSAVRSGDLGLAGDQLQVALDEWAGEPTEWAGPTDWAVEVGRQLSHAVGTVAATVIDALRRDGDHERASTLAARSVDVDPMDDRLWRLAVQAAGDVGAAALVSDLEARYQRLTSLQLSLS